MINLIGIVFWVLAFIAFFKGAYDMWREYRVSKERSVLFFLIALLLTWFWFNPMQLTALHPFVLMAYYWNRNTRLRNAMLALVIIPFLVQVIVLATSL